MDEPVLIILNRLERLENALHRELRNTQVKPAAQLVTALELLKQGHYKAAIQQVTPPLTEKSDLVIGHLMLGICFLRERKLAEVLAEQEALNRLSPEVGQHLAKCYHIPTYIVKRLEKNLPESPLPTAAIQKPILLPLDATHKQKFAYIAALIQIGRDARDEGEMATALSCFEAILSQLPHESVENELRPMLALAYFEKGFTLSGLGRLTDAILLVELAIALSPNEAKFYAELGYMYSKLKQYDRAMSFYERVRELDTPKNTDLTALALRGMGSIYIEKGELDLAEKLFRESLKLDPGNEVALNEITYIDILRRR